MKSPLTGEIRPEFGAIAEEILRRHFPLAGHPDDEIALPRFKLHDLLAQAAAESHLPPVMGRRHIVTVRLVRAWMSGPREAD